MNVIQGRKQRAYQDWINNNQEIYAAILGSRYINDLNTLYKAYYYTDPGNCTYLDLLHTEFNTTEILANGNYCTAIESCGWVRKAENGSACILSY